MNPTGDEQAQPKTSALAIWSLVLGILSLLCFSILSAIPGVICGHKALSRIKRSGGAIAGQGLAIAGLVTSYCAIGLSLILIPLMAAIAVPNFVKARMTAQRNACVRNLDVIDDAKRSWKLEKQKQDTDIPTVADIAPYLRDAVLPKCPAGGDYKINSVGEKPTCSISNHTLEQ
jgi:hypothetical protein